MSVGVGDTVIYTQPNDEPMKNGTQHHPATVTRVWSAECLNLFIMFDDGTTGQVTSVVRDTNPGGYFTPRNE